MSWLAVVLDVDAAFAESLSDALLESGALAVDVADAAAGGADERPLYMEAGAAPAMLWPRQRLKALFERHAELEALIPQALRASGVPTRTPYRVEAVDEHDWVRASQREFRPIRVSSRLWIVPSWHSPPDSQAINIVLDPGLAFGTGTHATTRLCLGWLEAHVQGGESVLDFGCGSGILAIAALKLGASRVRAVDIDEQALLAARHNAMQNRVEDRFVATAEAGEGPAQLVVANILAHPLIVLAPLLTRLTAAGGRIALSGILAAQANEVRAAYASGFVIDELVHEEGWTMLGGIRNSNDG